MTIETPQGIPSARHPRDPGRVITPVFALLVVATFACFLGVGVIVVTLPQYVEGHLGGGGTEVGLVVGAFSVAAVLARPFAGRLGDERGRRLLLVGGPAVMAAAVAAFPLADNVATLFVLRAVQGAGEASFYVGAASLVTNRAPADRRGEAISYFSVALYLGLAVGPALGEAVLGDDQYTRAWILASLLVVVTALLGLAVRDDPRPVRSRTRGPLVHPAGVVPGAALALGTMGFAAFAAFMPLYTKSVGVGGSGAVFGIFAGVTLVGRILGARIPDRLGPAVTARTGMAGVAAGLVTLGLWQAPAGVYVGTLLFAAGNAFVFPSLLTLAISAAPEEERGSVVGTVTAAFDASQGVGAFSLGPVAAATGYAGTFLVGGIAAAGGAALLAIYAQKAIPTLAPALPAGSAPPPAAPGG